MTYLTEIFGEETIYPGLCQTNGPDLVGDVASFDQNLFQNQKIIFAREVKRLQLGLRGQFNKPLFDNYNKKLGHLVISKKIVSRVNGQVFLPKSGKKLLIELKPEISRECLCAESCPLIESGHAFPEIRVKEGSFINDVTQGI